MANEWTELFNYLDGEGVVFDPFFEEKYAEAIAADDIAEDISSWSYAALREMKQVVYDYWLKEKERLGGWKEIHADEVAGEQGG